MTSVNVVAFAAGVPICVQLVVPSGDRSTMKPVSLLELSIQFKTICEDDSADATRLDGAVRQHGRTGVVAVAILEFAESPAESVERMR